MTLYRVALVACATLVATVLSSVAFAGCGGCCGGCGGYAATYVPAPPVPEVFAPPAYEYVQQIGPPVAPVPIALSPIGVAQWSGYGGYGGCGCCGCGNRGLFTSGFFGSPGYYIVNQGPQYSGPGIMLPYLTYAPGEGLAAPGAYPYIGPPYGYVGHPRYGYAPHPHYGYAVRARYAHHVHHYWHRRHPLGARG